MKKIVNAISALAAPVVENLGFELWNVEYVKEAGSWFLRVYIDKPGGVAIDDCEAVSRALDPILDTQDALFPGPYTFEVSSAGAERHLRRPSDFERFIGHLVEVKLYQSKNGRKEFLGHLKAYADGDVTIDAYGSELAFTKGEVAAVRLRIG